MKIELEPQDIEAIARRAAELVVAKLQARQEGQELETLFTVQTLAEYLNVKPSTVYNWVHLKKVPYEKHGKYTRFPKRKIDAWRAQNSVRPE